MHGIKNSLPESKKTQLLIKDYTKVRMPDLCFLKGAGCSLKDGQLWEAGRVYSSSLQKYTLLQHECDNPWKHAAFISCRLRDVVAQKISVAYPHR